VTHLPVYKFDGYTFRPATPDDNPLATSWNGMDPDHGWELQYPHFWIEQNDWVNSYVLEDAIGILFFVKSIRHMSHEIEITLQFDRTCGMVSKARVVRGLAAGFAWLREALPMNGFEALYFTSKNEQLVLFAQKRLGFFEDGSRQVYRMEA
jgi:hypothetical protein